MPQHTLAGDLYNSAPRQGPRGSSDHWQPVGSNSQNVVQSSKLGTNKYASEIVQYNQFGIVTPIVSLNLRDAGLSVANG